MTANVASLSLQGDDQLRRWYDDNVVDQKLAEEEIRVELASLSETVDAHKKLLEDELIDKVWGGERRQGIFRSFPLLLLLTTPL